MQKCECSQINRIMLFSLSDICTIHDVFTMVDSDVDECTVIGEVSNIVLLTYYLDQDFTLQLPAKAINVHVQ